MRRLEAAAFGAETVVEVADLDTECLREHVQAAAGDAVDALLVLVRLLIGDPDQLRHLLLGEPKHDAPFAHPRADVAVDVLRPRPALIPNVLQLGSLCLL